MHSLCGGKQNFASDGCGGADCCIRLVKSITEVEPNSATRAEANQEYAVAVPRAHRGIISQVEAGGKRNAWGLAKRVSDGAAGELQFLSAAVAVAHEHTGGTQIGGDLIVVSGVTNHDQVLGGAPGL